MNKFGQALAGIALAAEFAQGGMLPADVSSVGLDTARKIAANLAIV